MEEEIEKLQNEMNRLDVRADLVKVNRTNLDKLGGQANIFATALAAREMTVEQQLAIYAGLRQQAEKLDNEAQEIHANRYF